MANLKTYPTIALLVCIGAMAVASPSADAELDLEAAMHREIVLGDLRGAMAQYQSILARTDRSRPVAAKALFRIGECQQKSGQAEEAYNTFRRVTIDYTDQAEVVSQALIKMAAWSGPRNLRFEEGKPGEVPPGWLTPSLGKNSENQPELRRDGCRSRIGCAVVLVPLNIPKAVGELMQSFSAAAYRGKTVRLRAWLRLENSYVTPTGIHLPSDNGGDSAQMWLKVERAKKRLGFSDTGDDHPVLSDEWTQRVIIGTIDDDAQLISFGVMSIGGGRAWVDDVSFEVISQPDRK